MQAFNKCFLKQEQKLSFFNQVLNVLFTRPFPLIPIYSSEKHQKISVTKVFWYFLGM